MEDGRKSSGMVGRCQSDIGRSGSLLCGETGYSYDTVVRRYSVFYSDLEAPRNFSHTWRNMLIREDTLLAQVARR